jgi:hypothetical protein
MTDTPRTDNAAGDGTTVPADFAADLERELNAMTAERDAGNAALVNVARLMDSVSKAEAEVERLRALLKECADDLETEIEARRSGGLPRRIERDLEPVRKARAALKETK